MTNPSKQMYDSLHKAFDHFNKTLFGGELPPVILVVHRKRNAHGYFWAEQWNAKDGEDKLPEIALNPETMGRDEKEVLSTLVHEMVHHQQESFGTPPKTAYHNKEWADMMEAVGLIPTTTGERGGPRTGRNCTHVIDEGGVFDVECDKLMKQKSFDMSWFVRPQVKAKKRDLTKVKHTCPSCQTNIWGKLGINVECGGCEEVMEPQL
jgi:predicted SprT family Zn-dependent metalloprotease